MTDLEPAPALLKLSETDLTVDDPAQDVRGRMVVDRAGERIGAVADLYVDERERRVRFLQVAAGGFLGLGERHFLLPVGTVTRVASDCVEVDQSRDRIAGAPAYDPAVSPQPDYFAGIYNWYGEAPFWTPITVPERDVARGPGDRLAGRWEILPGTTVVGSDGEKVGDVVAAYRDYLVVQKGFFFPTDRYIPAGAIADIAGDRVRLNVTKDEAISQPWHAIPAAEPSAKGGAVRS